MKWYNNITVEREGVRTKTGLWEKFFTVFEKKYLTKQIESDIILKLLHESERQQQKVFWKNLKKYLTKTWSCDIILKLSQRDSEPATWKLNNAKKK